MNRRKILMESLNSKFYKSFLTKYFTALKFRRRIKLTVTTR